MEKYVRSQSATTSRVKRPKTSLPYAFTEQGVRDAFCGIAQWNGNTSKYLYYESICRHAQLYYDSYNRYFGIG